MTDRFETATEIGAIGPVERPTSVFAKRTRLSPYQREIGVVQTFYISLVDVSGHCFWGMNLDRIRSVGERFLADECIGADLAAELLSLLSVEFPV